MLMVIVSPSPLSFNNGDFELIAVGVTGADLSKNIYLNTRALQAHSKFYFEDGDYESTLALLKAELSNSKSIASTLDNWFDRPSVLYLSPSEVDGFTELYSLINTPSALMDLMKVNYNDDISVAHHILVNSLGELTTLMLREE